MPGLSPLSQTANFTQRGRYLSFRRQSGMATAKDETEAVVLDFLILVRRLVKARIEVEREVFLCAAEARPPAHSVYRVEARG